MKRQHLIFASYEIHPVTAGGCGVFLWHAINELLRTTDYKITLLLDIPKFECEEFIEKYKINMPNNNNLNVVCLSDRIPMEYLPMESFENVFMFKSYIFYRVLEQLVNEEHADYIEFFDYVGIGYFSINAKKFENKFKDTILGIRGHCTVDLMDLEQRQIDFSKDKIEMYQMEKLALQSADVVLVQTKAWKELYSRRYGIEIGKIVVAEPPMDNSDFPKYEPKINKNVLFYGRVFQLKGIDEYIQAGVQYLKENPTNNETNFYIVGYDGSTVDGKSYTEYVKKLIPDELKKRFIFTGKLDRIDFKNILNNISIAVFPNYVESFCYSIHEIYEAGVPIICKAIPAFTSYFEDGKNCLIYKNGVNELANKISTLLESNGLKKKISNPYTALERIGQRAKYDEILKTRMYDRGIQQVRKDCKISIIYVNNYSYEIDFKSYIKNLNYKDIESNKSFNIYINPEFTPNSEMKKIYFLGREVYVQTYDKEDILKLEQVVGIINIDDNISEEFIKKAQTIIEETDIAYVMSAYINENKNKFPKYALYKENAYSIYSKIQTMIINNRKKLNLNELFDSRGGVYGQIEYLQSDGYVIPETFGNKIMGNISTDGYKEQLIFSINNTDRDRQWNPFKMYSLLENEIYTKDDNNLFKKRLYHKVKERFYKSNGGFGKICLRCLECVKKIYLRIGKLMISRKDRR